MAIAIYYGTEYLAHLLDMVRSLIDTHTEYVFILLHNIHAEIVGPVLILSDQIDYGNDLTENVQKRFCESFHQKWKRMRSFIRPTEIQTKISKLNQSYDMME